MMQEPRPTCAACQGRGVDVRDGGRCRVCRGSAAPPPAPADAYPEPPVKTARMYAAHRSDR